jgi:hypothetical protein
LRLNNLIGYCTKTIGGDAFMRFKTKQIELEAVKYDGHSIPEFAAAKTSTKSNGEGLSVETDEGSRECTTGDYFVLTDNGQLLVRNGGIFEAVFEPTE